MSTFRTAPSHGLRLLLPAAGLGLIMVGILVGVLLRYRAELHEEIRRTVIGRDAAVLLPVTRHRVAQASTRKAGALGNDGLVAAVLPSAQQEGMLAVAVFDSQGNLLRSVPENLLFAELAAPDYLALLDGAPLSRFHSEFPLDRYFAGARSGSNAPVLEVILPLGGGPPHQPAGFVQYYLDARALARELALIEARLERQFRATLAVGIGLIALVLAIAYLGVSRAQRLVAERNARLVRANFELTLAAKASALGQIASHLIHGLQGSVAGLRATVAAGPAAPSDWAEAAQHTERIQSLISEAVGLLADTGTGALYELTGQELASIIMTRGRAAAAARGVRLDVICQLRRNVDSHRGSILCLVAANLVQNAVAATRSGGRVEVRVHDDSQGLLLSVSDEGDGVSEEVRGRLFQPGASSRQGGTGLGLAISRLLARQLGGELSLHSTGPQGSAFHARFPETGRN